MMNKVDESIVVGDTVEIVDQFHYNTTYTVLALFESLTGERWAIIQGDPNISHPRAIRRYDIAKDRKVIW